MYQTTEIKKDIFWTGVNDRRTHLFENYWPLPKGVAYNSYVILDEKIAVIDTVERSRMEDYLDVMYTVVVLKHRKSFGISYDGQFRIVAKQGFDGAGMVGFHVVDDEVVYFSALQDVFQFV